MNPSTYDREKAIAVCERLIEEPHLGLAAILREAEIPRSTWCDWRKAHSELDQAYKEAKEVGFDNLAQQCLQIAEDKGNDFIQTEKGAVFNAEHVQRSKLKIETRLKLLAKWFPERYGDKITHANDPAAPFGRETDEELQARFNKLAEKLRAAEQPE